MRTYAIALSILISSIIYIHLSQELTCDQNEEYYYVLIYGAHNLYDNDVHCEPKYENQLIGIINSPTNNKENNSPKVPYFRGNLLEFKQSLKQQHSTDRTAIQIINEPVKHINIIDYGVEMYIFDDSILMNDDIFKNIFEDLYLNKIYGVNDKGPNCAQSLKIYHSRKCSEETTSQNANGEQLCTDMLLHGNQYNYIINYDDIYGINTYECNEMNENSNDIDNTPNGNPTPPDNPNTPNKPTSSLNAVSTNNQNEIKTDDTNINYIININYGDYIGEYSGVIAVIGIVVLILAIVIIIILLCMCTLMNRKNGGVYFNNKGETHITNFTFYTQ